MVENRKVMSLWSAVATAASSEAHFRRDSSAIAPEDVSPTSLMDKLAPRAAGNGHIFAESTLSSLGQKLFQEWQNLREQGHEHDSVGDVFYLSVRNRYHFGQNSMLWSRVGRRFDPLYSVSAATAATRLPLYSRQTNVLGFDVMESFGLNMEKYPFDTNRFTDAYKTLRRAPRQLEFSSAGPVRFDDSHQISYGGNVSLPSALERLAVASPTFTGDQRKAVVEKANKIGLNYWHIAKLEPAQKSLRAGLDEFGLDRNRGTGRQRVRQASSEGPLDQTSRNQRLIFNVWSCSLARSQLIECECPHD